MHYNITSGQGPALNAKIPQGMSKRKQSRKVYGKNTHYWRQEMKPLLLAAACVDIAVKHSKEASAIYQRIIDAWDRPDCQALLKDNIALPVTEIRAWFKAAAEKKEYIPELDIWTGLHERYSKIDDIKYLFGLITEFIKVGFNRKTDLVKSECKVLSSKAIYLCFAVGVWTIGSYLEKHTDWEGETQLKLGDKVLDASALDGVSSERFHRLLSKALKRYGYRLSHDKKLRNIARLWYLSRVVYSGPEECCIKLQLEGENWTSANLVKEIYLCDIATGYPRKNLLEQSLS